MTVTIDGTSGVVTPAINVGQLAGFRNKIINGAMEFAQRGTSFVSPANSTYTLDRFLWSNGTSAVVTITQDNGFNSVPGYLFNYSLKVAVTTADASIAAGDYAGVEQYIEGYNVRDLIGNTFTFSFWVKSPKTGTHCVSFSNSGSDRSYVLEYSVNSANTWEYKSVIVTGGLITTGTWTWTNGIGLRARFSLAAGTTYQTTAGAWQTGNFLATSNQVNCLDSNTNVFSITGVQLEIGNTATPFERRLYGTELLLCQRYYETNSPLGMSANTGAYTTFSFQFTTKRVTPAITTTNFPAIFTGIASPNGYSGFFTLNGTNSSSGILTASAEL